MRNPDPDLESGPTGSRKAKNTYKEKSEDSLCFEELLVLL
jgi:hypothetical protein